MDRMEFYRERPVRLLKSDLGGDIPRDWPLNSMQVNKLADHTPPTGVRDGTGIVIAHVDTGYRHHDAVNMHRYDLARAYNGFTGLSGPVAAEDPFTTEDVFLAHPAHGMTASSVIVGSAPGTADGITGIAPGARIVPIRAIESVVCAFGSDAAIVNGLNHANNLGADCHVVLMCFGGPANSHIRGAIQDAVYDRNTIVLAAAGNKVSCVWEPGSLDETITIAGCEYSGVPWSGSACGTKVAVAAPADRITYARFVNHDPARQDISHEGDGTTFATSFVAGLAAIWLAWWGREHLLQVYAGIPLQAVFDALIRMTAVEPTFEFLQFTEYIRLNNLGNRPAGPEFEKFITLKRHITWPKTYGTGIVRADHLIRAGLPDPEIIRNYSKIPLQRKAWTMPPGLENPLSLLERQLVYGVNRKLIGMIRTLIDQHTALQPHAREIIEVFFREDTYRTVARYVDTRDDIFDRAEAAGRTREVKAILEIIAKFSAEPLRSLIRGVIAGL